MRTLLSQVYVRYRQSYVRRDITAVQPHRADVLPGHPLADPKSSRINTMKTLWKPSRAIRKQGSIATKMCIYHINLSTILLSMLASSYQQ